jgi:putative PIN family toxin of toxin-antitoxin system
VLDSTVLVSAFLRFIPGAASYELLRFADGGRFELCLSEGILAETAQALVKSKRNKRLYSYSDENVLEYCRALGRFATIVTNLPDIKLVRDPTDDKILACALAAGADYLVTRDKDLLFLTEHEGIRTITPETFLHLLRQTQEEG